MLMKPGDVGTVGYNDFQFNGGTTDKTNLDTMGQ
jgi:hypothetical protein